MSFFFNITLCFSMFQSQIYLFELKLAKNCFKLYYYNEYYDIEVCNESATVTV